MPSWAAVTCKVNQNGMKSKRVRNDLTVTNCMKNQKIIGPNRTFLGHYTQR